jgi:hypothetical protein
MRRDLHQEAVTGLVGPAAYIENIKSHYSTRYTYTGIHAPSIQR